MANITIDDVRGAVRVIVERKRLQAVRPLSASCTEIMRELGVREMVLDAMRELHALHEYRAAIDINRHEVLVDMES